ncbi:MAG: SDR family oxidoreductase [Actinomycetota bacterium]|nr:SDR family oxidoreductase [Actinomycetota bacterium]
MRCLVTGATGYIGGRLVPRLLAEGHAVRCLARSPDKLRDVPWAERVEVARGDVLDSESLHRAMGGVDVVYYLVHSLTEAGFAALDRRGALLTAQAARDAGVSRIVYLGGPHPGGDRGAVSEHLGSRAEVGEIFLCSGVPTAVLQAAVVIGSGSASFEMLRHLTERLPVMVTPRWVRNRVQPIAIRDVLHYLVGAALLPPEVNRSFDIGGPDVLTYEQMMQRYAAVSGLPRRWMVPVALLSPRLSSHWINIVTPVPKGIGAPLIESLVHEAVCREDDIADFVPPPPGGRTGYDTAVRLALDKIRRGEVETHWSDASVPDSPSDPLPTDPGWAGGSWYVDHRSRRSSATPEQLWHVVQGIGGSNGWYSFPLAWAARGWVDRLVGGVGLRRGRRHPQELRVGDALDWWRVEELRVDPADRMLRLRAEMKVPGYAWLELRVQAGSGGGSVYQQRAVFIPHGLAGHLYWWAVVPFHGIVFGGMARNITRTAEGGNLMRSL